MLSNNPPKKSKHSKKFSWWVAKEKNCVSFDVKN